jgi:hypothetical protein
VSAGLWDGRRRLAQLEGRAVPERHLPEVVRCRVCRAVLRFESDANGAVVEQCRCGVRRVERRRAEP